MLKIVAYYAHVQQETSFHISLLELWNVPLPWSFLLPTQMGKLLGSARGIKRRMLPGWNRSCDGMEI